MDIGFLNVFTANEKESNLKRNKTYPSLIIKQSKFVKLFTYAELIKTNNSRERGLFFD